VHQVQSLQVNEPKCGSVLEAVGTMLETHSPRGSGATALASLDSGSPVDLLITDVVITVVHGFNLARMRRPSLRVIYFSGFHQLPSTNQDRGELLGKLLRKPVRFDELNQDRRRDAWLRGKLDHFCLTAGSATLAG